MYTKVKRAKQSAAAILLFFFWLCLLESADRLSAMKPLRLSHEPLLCEPSPPQPLAYVFWLVWSIACLFPWLCLAFIPHGLSNWGPSLCFWWNWYYLDCLCCFALAVDYGTVLNLDTFGCGLKFSSAPRINCKVLKGSIECLVGFLLVILYPFNQLCIV